MFVFKITWITFAQTFPIFLSRTIQRPKREETSTPPLELSGYEGDHEDETEQGVDLNGKVCFNSMSFNCYELCQSFQVSCSLFNYFIYIRLFIIDKSGSCGFELSWENLGFFL